MYLNYNNFKIVFVNKQSDYNKYLRDTSLIVTNNYYTIKSFGCFYIYLYIHQWPLGLSDFTVNYMFILCATLSSFSYHLFMQYILCIVYDKFPQDFSSTSLHFSNIFHLIPSRSDIEKPNPEK